MSAKLYDIRDPVHLTILFDEREKQIMDHPFVQRLRFVRQLDLQSLVYPGAVHTRFEHVVGAMHLAGRVFDALDQESEVFKRLRVETRRYLRRMLRLAGLLHDIGHGPFSHASEHLMPKLGALKIPRSWWVNYDGRGQAEHEDYSVLLIATLASSKEKILTMDEAQDIASLVHKLIKPSVRWKKRFASPEEAEGYHAFLKRLISGELDVDRMDYLLRDAYFAGVPYGQYDLEWLLQTIGATMTKGGPVLVIREVGMRAFENFLLARYHMFLQVYFHRTSAMFRYYAQQAMEKGEIALHISADPYEYAEMRDGSIIEALFAAAKDPKNEWSCRLAHRISAKFLYKREGHDPKSEKQYQVIVGALKRAKIPCIELGARKTLLEHAVTRPGRSRILVARKILDRLQYVPVETVSTLLQKYNEQIDRTNVYVLREHYQDALRVLHKTIR